MSIVNSFDQGQGFDMERPKLCTIVLRHTDSYLSSHGLSVPGGSRQQWRLGFPLQSRVPKFTSGAEWENSFHLKSRSTSNALMQQGICFLLSVLISLEKRERVLAVRNRIYLVSTFPFIPLLLELLLRRPRENSPRSPLPLPSSCASYFFRFFPVCQ